MEADSKGARAEELLGHRDWVLKLAESLLSDPQSADDVAQETWLAALRRPPEEGRAPRPWLASVVRNFARERLRQDGGRRARERQSAKKDQLPPTDELLEKLETQRVLAEAVRALTEPYRTTILLRYFEELSAAEIARRQGVPAATVRSRLQRGLAELRERLDGHFGGRSAWGLALGALLSREGAVGVGIGGGVSALSGVLVMNVLAKTALALAVLLFASAGVFLATREPQAAEPAAAPAEATVSVELEVPAVEPSAPAPAAAEPAREQVATTLAALEEPEPEAAEVVALARVEGRCVDEHGAPIAGASLRVIDELPFIESAHGASGEVAFELDLDTDSRLIDLVASSPGRATVFLEARLYRGESTHLGDIVLAPAGTVAGYVRFDDGRGVPDAHVQITDPEMRWSPEAARRRGPEVDRAVPEARTGSNGYFEIAGAAVGSARVWAGLEGMRFSFTDPIEISGGERNDDLELVLVPLEREDVIEGVVLDPDGNGVAADIRYEWKAPGRSGSAGIWSDEEGFFSLKLPARVPTHLTASAPEDGWGNIRIEDVQPGTLDVVFQFEEARTTTLRVRSASGVPVERYGVTILNAGETEWLATHRYDEHAGGLTSIDVPTTSFIVRVSAREHALKKVGPLVPGDVGDELLVELEPVPGVHGVVTHDGEPVPGARVELRAVYSGTQYVTHNGFRLLVQNWADIQETTDEEGRFVLTLREDDKYVIFAEADGYALGQSRAYDLDTRSGARGLEVELFRGGSIEGRVKVDRGRDPSGTIVGINRGDGRAKTVRVGPDGRYRFDGLTPGGWQVLRSDHEINPSSSSTSMTSGNEEVPVEWTCTVYEGETTYHDVDLREKKACELIASFLINGKPAVGWSARVTLHAPVTGAQVMPSAAVGADGSFKLSVSEPNDYDLVLERPYALGRMQLEERLTLEPGATVWSLDLEAGSLAGENAPTVGAGELAVRYHWFGPERGLDFSAYFHGDDLGRFSLPTAPAGPGVLQRHTSTVEEGWTVSSWEKLFEVEIEAAAVERVVLP
jgi:RNA polymerase sigma-70 factor (ECF subfamily)